MPTSSGVSRRHRPGERAHPVELDAKPRAQHDAHLSEARPKIDGADRQHRRCSARAGDAAVAGTCRTIVPGGSDDERVESSRTRGSARDRAVGKTGERLRNADECDTRRVVRIAVAVRVDRSLEPGENLVRASVHRPARGRVALPPRDTDRQHRRARCNTRECAGTAGADQQTGHLRTVPLELSRLVRARSRQCAGLTTDDVDASRDATAQEGLGTIDTRIEQSDRHAAAVLVGQPDVRTLAELGARQQPGAERSRVGGAHRIDACHLRGALEQRDAARVERGREPVDRARVAELGLDDDALYAQTSNEQLLRREGACTQRRSSSLGREAAGTTDSIRKRRRLQQDDDSLSDGHAGPLRPGEPLPARVSELRYAAAATARGDEDGGDDDRKGRKHQRIERLTRWTRRHREQDSRDTGWPR